MSATLVPLTATVINTPWGTETIQPSADEVAIYAALSELAAGTTVASLEPTYTQATPFGSMKFSYRPGTLAIVAAIAAIAAAK